MFISYLTKPLAHNVYDGGYCPVGISFEERTRLLAEDKETFRRLVDKKPWLVTLQ